MWLLWFFVGRQIGRNEKQGNQTNLPPISGADLALGITMAAICGLAMATTFWLVWHNDVLTTFLVGENTIQAFINHFLIGSFGISLCFAWLYPLFHKRTILFVIGSVTLGIFMLLTSPPTHISGLWIGAVLFGILCLLASAKHIIQTRRH